MVTIWHGTSVIPIATGKLSLVLTSEPSILASEIIPVAIESVAIIALLVSVSKVTTIVVTVTIVVAMEVALASEPWVVPCVSSVVKTSVSPEVSTTVVKLPGVAIVSLAVIITVLEPVAVASL